MEKTIGFIGSGNMANAMIAGMLKAKLVPPTKIISSNPSKNKLEEMQKNYGITITTNNCEVASKADILVLSIKPQFYRSSNRRNQNKCERQYNHCRYCCWTKNRKHKRTFW